MARHPEARFARHIKDDQISGAPHTVQSATTHQSLKHIAKKPITLVYFKHSPVAYVQTTVSVKAIDKLQNLHGIIQ